MASTSASPLIHSEVRNTRVQPELGTRTILTTSLLAFTSASPLIHSEVRNTRAILRAWARRALGKEREGWRAVIHFYYHSAY